MLANVEQNVFWKQMLQQSPSPYGTHILLLKRLGSRIVKNSEDLVIKVIEEFVNDRGYTLHVSDFKDLALEQQIIRSSRATVFASSHGAGITNAMWMVPGSEFIAEK